MVLSLTCIPVGSVVPLPAVAAAYSFENAPALVRAVEAVVDAAVALFAEAVDCLDTARILVAAVVYSQEGTRELMCSYLD